MKGKRFNTLNKSYSWGKPFKRPLFWSFRDRKLEKKLSPLQLLVIVQPQILIKHS